MSEPIGKSDKETKAAIKADHGTDDLSKWSGIISGGPLDGGPVAVTRDDVSVALWVLRETRFTLAQAIGYIRTVSEQRVDGGVVIAESAEERISEITALTERLRGLL